MARYRYAGAQFRARVVLDAGSGTGYGAHVLTSAGARSVVSVDIDPEAATATPSRGDHRTVRGDVLQLPFRSESFDGCVALEILEHVHDQERLISELGRVMIRGAVMVLSTPDRLSRSIPHDNPYHVREVSPSELSDLLPPRFKILHWAGQYFETGTPIDLLRAWVANSRIAEHLRRVLPVGARTASGRLAFGSSEVVEVPAIGEIHPATIVVVAARL